MLSGGAIRELAWMLLKETGVDPSPHFARLHNRGERAKALRELEEAGLAMRSASTYILSNYIYIGVGANAPIMGGYAPKREEMLPPSMGGNAPVLGGNAPTDTSCYDLLLEEACQLDLLPVTQRRARQYPFVQRIWKEIYPAQPPLNATQATNILDLQGSAERTYLLFQEFQGNPKVNIRYLAGVVKNRKAREAVRDDDNGEVEWDEAEHAAWLEKCKEAQQLLKASGYDYE